jgi:hypothetical protein
MGGPFGFPVLGIQPDVVSNVEIRGRLSMVICILLIPELGSSHLAAHMVMDTGQCLGGRAGSLVVGVARKRRREVELALRIVAIQAKEGRDSGCFRGLIVGRKFGERKPVRPIVLKIIDMGAEVLLHDGVDSLSLAVSLRMECRGKASIDTEAVAQSSPEVSGELRTSI